MSKDAELVREMRKKGYPMHMSRTAADFDWIERDWANGIKLDAEERAVLEAGRPR